MPQLLSGTIPVVDTLSPEQFKKQHYKSKNPVILTKYTANWKAQQLWSPQWFLEEYRDCNIWVSPLAFGLSHPPNYEMKMRMDKFMYIVEQQQKSSEEFWVKEAAVTKDGSWIAQRRSDGATVNLNGETLSSPQTSTTKQNSHHHQHSNSHSKSPSLQTFDDSSEDSPPSPVDSSQSQAGTQLSTSIDSSKPKSLHHTHTEPPATPQKATIESKLGKHTIFYCQQCPTRTLPGLTSYYPHPDLFDHCEESVFGANSFFIGSKNIRSTLHYDRPLVDNLFCQIYGKKRVRLYAPEQGVHFYQFPLDSRYAHVSKIPDIDHVDTERFPDFQNAVLTADVILEPGDSLYIPKGWHHHVEHNHSGWDQFDIPDRDRLSISLNFWYY